jgi:hypothetical protein
MSAGDSLNSKLIATPIAVIKMIKAMTAFFLLKNIKSPPFTFGFLRNANQ